MRIYSLIPTPHRSSNTTVKATSEARARHGDTRRPSPATLILRHDIVIKGFTTEGQYSVSGGEGSKHHLGIDGVGKRKSFLSRVTCLATHAALPGERESGGAGILIGIAEGRHLCVWDLTTGSTLFTAVAVAPDGCSIEEAVWHAPAALVALVHSFDQAARRVDVYQLEIYGKSINKVNRVHLCFIRKGTQKPLPPYRPQCRLT